MGAHAWPIVTLFAASCLPPTLHNPGGASGQRSHFSDCFSCSLELETTNICIICGDELVNVAYRNRYILYIVNKISRRGSRLLNLVGVFILACTWLSGWDEWRGGGLRKVHISPDTWLRQPQNRTATSEAQFNVTRVAASQ